MCKGAALNNKCIFPGDRFRRGASCQSSTGRQAHQPSTCQFAIHLFPLQRIRVVFIGRMSISNLSPVQCRFVFEPH